MNERTLEIYKQALQFAYNTMPEETFQTDLFHSTVVGKFCELIVQECANEILKWKSEPFPFDPEFAAKLIKEHFEIK